MDESASNPYKAPEAAVSEAAGEKLSDVYDRFTAWAVFGLGVITLGIYYIYWMYTRTRRLNPHIEEPISDAFIYTTLVLYFGGLLNYIAPALGLPPAVVGLIGVASMVGGIMSVVWAFKLRNRIHTYLGSSKGSVENNWFNAFWVFFLNAWYLQYKMNKIIDSE